MNAVNKVLDYLNDGGAVSYSLFFLFLTITYSVGFRLALLYKGKDLDVRDLFKDKIKDDDTVQANFFAKLQDCKKKCIGLTEEREEFKKRSEWFFIDGQQSLARFSSLLNTAVLLAPLLGLLGTVIGMIETFSSLSDSDLFSSSGGIAGGISQALLTTQFGLIVAIPGVLLSRFLKKIENKTLSDLVQIRELFLVNEGNLHEKK